MHTLRQIAGKLFLLALFGCLLGPGKALAQFNEIRFPSPPVEGQPILIEMYWRSACPSFVFRTSLYDIQLIGSQIQATVDTASSGGSVGVCPPVSSGWEQFQLPPLPPGNYSLTIHSRHFIGDSPDPVGPPSEYATATFTVAAAPPPPRAHSIPVISAWSALLLIVLSSLAAWLALRR
ncbi:MAG: hypothetical protein KDI75_03560 [Xanthomonadales bacterium]|nr:hypothetical protein [Xanthomonadales bacterium]